MGDGVDTALMEICAAAMFLVHASPSDLAVGEEEIAAVMVIVKAWMEMEWWVL